MHACTYRTKFYKMTAAVSLAACTCALGLPVDVFAQTAAVPSSHVEKPAQTPAPAAAPAPTHAPKHSAVPATDRSANDANTKVYDTAANYKKHSEDDYSITYSYVKNNQKITNPFPDIISDAEIEKEFKNRDHASINKTVFIPTATADNPHPTPVVLNVYDKLPKGTGTFKQCAVFKFAKLAYPIQLYAGACGGFQSRNGLIAADGSVYAGSNQTAKYEMHHGSFKINGYTLPGDGKNAICVSIEKDNAPENYFYYEISASSDSELYERVLMNGGVSSTTGGYETTFLVNDLTPYPDAQFHFVDDLQYRALNPGGVNPDDSLKQRGNSDTHPSLSDEDKKKGTLISALPLYEIPGLASIPGVDPVTTDVASFSRSTGGDLKTPILSFKDDPKAKDRKRPTLADLTGTKIPGYVYWDNDIDKPQNTNHEFANDNATKEDPGNHYLSFAYEMKDGKPVKRLTRKHYYVTFRALPTRLVVQYKGLDNKIKTDQAFGLYTTRNSSPALINDKLKSREAPQTEPTKDALVQMMKNANTSFLDNGAGYLSDGFAYLLPGTYMVKPTLKAPDGYEWVIETKETNKKTQADLKVSLQTKEADPTQQVVTFVLKKKPTPTPTPTPYPLSVPEVPAPVPAPAPVPEHKVPALEAPAPKTPAAPAEAPAPLMRKHARTLPQTGDPMAISAVGELGMMLGILSASLAATLRRKRR